MSDETPAGRPLGAHARAYRGMMDRVGALVADLDDGAADRFVPATPDWRVRDLLAHVVGVTADVIGGHLEGVATDPWTAAQVEARRGRSVAELLAEWEGNWPDFSRILSVAAEVEPVRIAQAIFDAMTHEQDLRGALDRPGARQDEGWDIAWTFCVRAVGGLRDRVGAGALALRPTDADDVVAGHGEVAATVRAPRFELVRAMSGRRSAAQILAWEWTGPAAPEHLCFFPPRATDLVE